MDATDPDYWQTPQNSAQSQLLNPSQRPVILVGIEIGVFRALTGDASHTWTVQSLAAVTQCDDGLIYRFMRYFFSIGIVTEYPDLTYGANPTTFWLATDAAEAHVASLQLDSSHDVTPDPNPLDFSTHPSSVPGSPPDQPTRPFHTFPAMPERTYRFAELMRTRRRFARDWTAAFPVQTLQLNSHEPQNPRDPQTPRQPRQDSRTLFVDVGGARGSQCVSLRQRHPQLQGQMVVQDRATVLALADSDALRALGITTMVHDLLAPQPILGAKAYYLRHVLHEWPDDACVAVLQSLEAAMADDSLLLIDEMIRQDSRLQLSQGQQWMEPILTPLTIMERTEAQWREIITRAGLRVDQVRLYEPMLNEGIIRVSRFPSASRLSIA